MNGFKPIRFSLPVVAMDEVESWTPAYLAAEISEFVCRDRLKEHATILTQRCRGEARVETSTCYKQPARWFDNENEQS